MGCGHPKRAHYWLHYGPQMRGRHDDAVQALRTAERAYPAKVLRDPFVRDTIAVLLRRARKDAVGQELRDIARRAGLLG